jgi:hypothetical protein
MNDLKKKSFSRLREVEHDGCKIIVKVHPAKEWKDIAEKLTKSKDAEKAMAELISEHILDLDSKPIFTPEELINDVCNDVAEEFVNLIKDVNGGKKKATKVFLQG